MGLLFGVCSDGFSHLHPDTLLGQWVRQGGCGGFAPNWGSTPALRPKLGGYGYIVNTLGNLGLVVRALAAKH